VTLRSFTWTLANYYTVEYGCVILLKKAGDAVPPVISGRRFSPLSRLTTLHPDVWSCLLSTERHSQWLLVASAKICHRWRRLRPIRFYWRSL